MGGFDGKMRLSIVICAYNEERCISNLLQNIPSQKLPPEITDYEVIVVASGCTDRTVPIVKKFMTRNSKIRLIEEPERLGKATALNKALSAATGDYIVLIPADVSPEENGLYNLVIPLRDPKVVVVSGRPLQDPRHRRVGFAGYLMNMTFRIWGRLMRTLNDAGLAAHGSGEFMAVRSKIVTRIPEECAADDSYISVVAKRHGFIKFVPEAICYNSMPSNLRDYINQRRRWLYGHFQVHMLTGEYPTVMDTLIFTNPQVVMKVLSEEIRDRPKEIPFLVSAILIESVIYILTILDTLLRRQYAIWPIIKSTKTNNQRVRFHNL